MFTIGLLVGIVITLAFIQWKTGLVFDTFEIIIENTKNIIENIKNFFRNLINKK